MATVKIQYSCGCEVVCQTIEAAVKHCDEKRHKMTVSGTIEPSPKEMAGTTSARTPQSRIPVIKSTRTADEIAADDARVTSEFDAFRAKLGVKTRDR